MTEAERKRSLTLEAAGDRLVTSRPADVRWLLCGRGQPVDAAAPSSAYTVVLEDGRASVLFADIEESRVRAEERFDELGYELERYPWHEGHGLEETPSTLDPLRLELCEEVGRYWDAGADAADAVRTVLRQLRLELTELVAAAELAREARARGFFPAVVLVGGEARQGLHRHPLPTGAPLGRHALLAITAEREGLHVSLTRIVSFGPPPAELARLVRLTAEVDAEMLAASRPGVRLDEVVSVAARAYEERGFPEEWRRHHLGGLTGHKGREVSRRPRSGWRSPRPPRSPGTRRSQAAPSRRTPRSSRQPGSR